MAEKRIKKDKRRWITFRTHFGMFEYISDVRALAIYHFYKAHYSNSTIFNFSYRKLSAELGMSHKVVKKCIEELIEIGWAVKTTSYKGRTKTGKSKKIENLTFVSTTKIGNSLKLKKSLFKTIRIPRKANIKQIVDILYTISLDCYKSRQEHILRVKEDIKLMNDGVCFNVKKTKRLMKLKNVLDGKSYQYCVLNSRNLANKWGVSHVTASEIVKRLEKKGLIRRRRIIYPYEHGQASFGYVFFKRGMLLIDRGTYIDINSDIFYEYKWNQKDC